MNSALLLALNTLALAALVMFHFQSANGEDAVSLREAVPHHLQQRPQLAVMMAGQQSPVGQAQHAHAAPLSEHWVF